MARMTSGLFKKTGSKKTGSTTNSIYLFMIIILIVFLLHVFKLKYTSILAVSSFFMLLACYMYNPNIRSGLEEWSRLLY